ncbi:MAG: transposase [Anaerolineales bacterium]
MSEIYYRRRLPHIHPENHPFFITFNLADSIPSHVWIELKQQREKELQNAKPEQRHQIHKKYFGKYDEWLDRAQHGNHWLAQTHVAQTVSDEIHRMDGERYRLLACCLMPNHVHLLIESLITGTASHDGMSRKYPLTEIMRLLKGRTARACNLALNRNGKFWQHESYDHYVRNDEELGRIVAYILHNPVKAGLTKEWTEWKFTYLNPDLGEW